MGYGNYMTNWFGKGDPQDKALDYNREQSEKYDKLLREWLGITSEQTDRQTDIQEEAIDKQMQLIDMMMGMTGDYWTKAAPTRNAVLGRLGKFMESGMDPTTSVLYPYGKDVIEQKYGQGKEEMISTLPEGGAMYAALGDLERGKSSSYLDLVQKIVGDEYNKAYGVATGAGNYGLLGNAIPGLASGLNTSGAGINSLITSAMSGSLGGLNAANNWGSSLLNNSYQSSALSSKLWDNLGSGIGEAWSNSDSGSSGKGEGKGDDGGNDEIWYT